VSAMAVKLRGQIKKLGTAQKFDENANPRVTLTLTLEVDGASEDDVSKLVEMQRGGEITAAIQEVQPRMRGT